MDSRTGVGEIVDASSSYFWQNRHSMYTDQEGGGLIFEGKQVYVVCCFVFIDLRVKQVRNNASSCPWNLFRTLRFYYVASSPGSPLPHFFDGHRKLVGSSAIPARSCPDLFVCLDYIYIYMTVYLSTCLFFFNHTRPRMEKPHSKRHELVNCPFFSIAR